MIDLRLGDCFEVMQSMADNSIDLVLTDPPYGLSLMGKEWDYDVPSVEAWTEAFRVLKPGGHLLAFAGTRTQHRMACRIEDAGFEIRDMLIWAYGSGMPKSKNQLKPAIEPITMARKPMMGTVAANISKYGTGGLNIDSCKVGTNGGGTQCNNRDENGKCMGHKNAGRSTSGETFHGPNTSGGRWPSNLAHDGSDEVLDLLPNNSGRFYYCPKVSAKERGGAEHPTVKPIALMEYLVKLASSEGQVILDPFMGSGTTGIACQNLNRKFIGIEMDQAYFEIAKSRINNAASEVLF